MTSRKFALAILVVLAVAVPARGAGGLSVLYPPDLTLALRETIKVHVFQPGGGAPTYVKVNGKAAATLEGGEFRNGDVSLGEGFNNIEIGAKLVRVFRVSGAKMDSFRLPAGEGQEPFVFQAYNLHPALDEGCEVCHALEDGKLAAKDQKEACYACHTDFGAEKEGEKKFVHAPVAAGECTGCHDPHFAPRPKLQRSEKGCLECHDAFPSEGVVHRPVAEGKCTACHSPHAGPAPKQVLRAGNALCLGCHEDSHVQHRTVQVKGTVTQVPDDFPREKDKLSCLGCHKPHQSEERRLFALPQGKLCQTCHRV